MRILNTQRVGEPLGLGAGQRSRRCRLFTVSCFHLVIFRRRALIRASYRLPHTLGAK